MTLSEVVTLTAGNIYGKGEFSVEQSVEAARAIHEQVVNVMKASYKTIGGQV